MRSQNDSSFVLEMAERRRRWWAAEAASFSNTVAKITTKLLCRVLKNKSGPSGKMSNVWIHSTIGTMAALSSVPLFFFSSFEGRSRCRCSQKLHRPGIILCEMKKIAFCVLFLLLLPSTLLGSW
jgi:hypothetical protein